MSWPTSPPPWLLPWLIWRFRGANAADRPAGTPKTIPAWAFGVAVWAGWCRKGRITTRPKSTAKAPIPDRIPQWAWQVLKGLNIAVPVIPPPPPPPPPNPVPANSWRLPMPLLFTSWGPRLDWRRDHDFDLFLQKVVTAKIPTLALQIGMFPEHYPDRVRSMGVHVALWTPQAADGDQQALDEAEAEAYVPQAETTHENALALHQLQLGTGRGLSLSAVGCPAAFETFTNRPDSTADGEQTTVEAEALIAAGCTHMFVESYTGDMQARDVGNEMTAMTKWRGVYHANPVAGLAGRPNVFLSTYSPDIDEYGRQIGVYLAEPMRDVDWAAVRSL